MTATGSARGRAWEEMDERQPTADLAGDGSRHLRRGYENRASVRASPLHQPLLVPTTTLPLLPPPLQNSSAFAHLGAQDRRCAPFQDR